MPTPANTLTLTDYSGDIVDFDCDYRIKRLYIITRSINNNQSTCTSLDQNATQAIINHLTQWLDSIKSTIKPTLITRS